jgi:hypothetical protein
MNGSDARFDHLEHLSTSALVCLPFLDTDTSAEQPIANEILAKRGYSPALVRRLRGLAAVGLWWQVIAWEWASLDLWDVLAGYAVILAGLGLMLVLLGLTLIDAAAPWGVAVVVVAVLLLVTAVMGWRTSRARNEPR